jgi:putative FmdB family regulatory protein
MLQVPAKMPLYEYECSVCGHRFELIQRFADPPVETCAACGKGPVHKLLSAPAFHFKGTGWYVTDYAKKTGASAVKTDAGPSDAGKSDKASAESKPAAATAPAASSGSADEKKPAAAAAESKPAGESSK